MPRTLKSLGTLFLFLSLMLLGVDVYIWYFTDRIDFFFSDLGYLTKTYLTDYHQAVVNTLTPEVFDKLITPILQLPAIVITIVLAILFFAIGLLMGMNGKKGPENKFNDFKHIRR